jgi:hypothetical protein
MEKILCKGTTLYRGGACKKKMAFFAMNPRVARMYGTLCSFVTKRPARLFVLTHDSLKRVFKYLSGNTRLLMSFVFGTGIRRTNQEITLKKIFTSKSPIIKSFKKLGERLSVTEIDTIALASFSREFILPKGYDGVYMPEKKSKFHKGTFHSEMYISKGDMLTAKKAPKVSPHSEYQRSSYTLKSMSDLFLEYTKNTRSLLKPHPSQFVMFLGGGMAVKLYLEARGIKTAETSDFDFKFAVPRVLRTKRQVEKYSNMMRQIMYRHVSSFVRFLHRRGIHAKMEFKEVEGVPLDKPGGLDGSIKKKVYKVYNYSIVSPNGRRHELVDTSLVVIPGISRQHISLKWSRQFGLPIQTLTRLWRDTLYVLAGSFVVDTIKLRNPINGAKKDKGIKDAIRAGHLSYLTARKNKLKRLVTLSRKLIGNVVARNKMSGEKHSRQIIQKLTQLQLKNLARAQKRQRGRSRAPK